MEFTNAQFKAFRESVTEALKAVEKEFDVEIDFGGYRYSTNDFTSKMTVYKKSADGKDREQLDFEKYCTAFGLNADDYNGKVHYQGETWQIVGFNPRAPKYPLKIRNSQGKTYRGTEAYLDAYKQQRNQVLK